MPGLHERHARGPGYVANRLLLKDGWFWATLNIVITGTLIRGLNSAREQLAAGSKRRACGEALVTLICSLALVYICLTYPVPRSIQELEEFARRVTNDGG